MAEHKHGDMDITEQEQMFASFVSWVTRSVVVIIVVLILLAIINV